MITQQKGTADPQTDQEIRALTKTYDERFNKNDAAGVAALFTEDAVHMAPGGRRVELYDANPERSFAKRRAILHPYVFVRVMLGENACQPTTWPRLLRRRR
jgi:hypothetical protein